MINPHERELLAFTRSLQKTWPGSKRRRLRVWQDSTREVWIAPFSRGRFVRVAATCHGAPIPRRELTFMPSELDAALEWAKAWVDNPEALFPRYARGNEQYSWSIQAAAQADLAPTWLAIY